MANPQTAIAVIEQSPDAVVEWNLDNWPTDKFLRLVPTQTLGLVSDFIRPLIVTVQLDIETDTYESKDLRQGHRAPNAKGLSKLADAAGVNFVDEERLDDGSDPKRAYVRIYAEMVDGTGLKRRAPGSRDYVLDSQPMTDAQRQRARAYVHENAATRARLRALRALLSLPQSYPIEELRKPFAIARYVLNTEHPEIRDAVKHALVGAVAAVYGPPAAKQLQSGTVNVDEIADDDEPMNVTPAPATPTVLPGEKLAAASAPVSTAEPDWMQAAMGSAAASVATEPDIVSIIRDTAAASGMVGKATEPQLTRLRELLGGLNGTGIVPAALKALFGDVEMTAAHAQSLINHAAGVGDAEFVEQFRGIAGRAKAADRLDNAIGAGEL